MECLSTLPETNRYEISVRQWHPRLKLNLLARIHIPIRAIAEFTGHTEGEVKFMIKRDIYPRKEIKIGRRKRTVPLSTRELSPVQARKIEAELHRIAAEIGCPIPQPQHE